MTFNPSNNQVKINKTYKDGSNSDNHCNLKIENFVNPLFGTEKLPSQNFFPNFLNEEKKYFVDNYIKMENISKENLLEEKRKEAKSEDNFKYEGNLKNFKPKRSYIRKNLEKIKRWTKEESLLYEQFIKMHSTIMKDTTTKRNAKIFLLMSKFIGTKTPSQCRSHHQKFYRKVISQEDLLENKLQINNSKMINIPKKEKKVKQKRNKKKNTEEKFVGNLEEEQFPMFFPFGPNINPINPFSYGFPQGANMDSNIKMENGSNGLNGNMLGNEELFSAFGMPDINMLTALMAMQELNQVKLDHHNNNFLQNLPSQISPEFNMQPNMSSFNSNNFNGFNYDSNLMFSNFYNMYPLNQESLNKENNENEEILFTKNENSKDEIGY